MSPAAISAALFLLADVTDCLWRKGRPNRGRSKPGGAGRAEGSAWADILSAWQAETKAVFCCCGSSENAPDEASELERKRVRRKRVYLVVCRMSRCKQVIPTSSLAHSTESYACSRACSTVDDRL